MRTELTEMKVLGTTLGTTTIPTTTVITCTVCKKNGHDAHGCWFNSENKLKEAVKMKSDTEDIV